MGPFARERRWIVVLTIAGLCLRALWLLDATGLPWFEVPASDPSVYDRGARIIAGGDLLLSHESPRMSPGYFYFLGALYRIVGPGIGPRIVQLLLGTAAIPLSYLAAAEVLEDRRFALGAAAIVAAYGPAIFFEATLLPESIAPFLYALVAWRALCALRTARRRDWALAGLALGLACDVRPNALLMVVPLGVVALAPRGADPRRQRAARAGALALGVVLAVAPVTARNLAAFGEPIPLTAHAGLNLWIGNGPGATGTYRTTPEVPDADSPLNDHARFHAAAERAQGHELSFREGDAYWTRRTIDHAAAHPLDALLLLARKAHLFWNARELSLVLRYEFTRQLSVVLGAPLVQFGLVGPLALAAMLVMLAAGRTSERLVAGLLLAGMLSVVLVFVADRYRVAHVPLFALCAAWSLERIVRALRARDRGALATWGTLVALGCALAWPVRLAPYEVSAWVEHGDGHRALGHFAESLDAYRHALALDDRSRDALMGMAQLEEARERRAEAREWYRRAAAVAEVEGDAETAARAASALERLADPLSR